MSFLLFALLYLGVAVFVFMFLTVIWDPNKLQEKNEFQAVCIYSITWPILVAVMAIWLNVMALGLVGHCIGCLYNGLGIKERSK